MDPQYGLARSARRDCETALRLARQPEISEPNHWRGIVRSSSAVATQITLCRQYLRVNHDAGHGWWAYGRALISASRFDEALATLGRTTNLTPLKHRRSVVVEFGEIYKHRGDFQLAEHWYRQAIASDLDSAQGLVSLGRLFFGRGRLHDAEAALRSGTGCGGDWAGKALAELGLVLRSQERYAEASECLEQVVSTDPKNKSARTALRDCSRAMEVVGRDARSSSLSFREREDDGSVRYLNRAQ